ncbi:unnamed protein product [Leptidea sinapis]|uniref:Uncharacterized protein n=1 Tax=Leptidea sinapis TaxID=189913 RepID=A0A5E4R642_9NEOP|nr:unnamed protein product [Leptidea sinapis]
MSKLDNDGFQVVSSKRASKNKSTKLSHQSQEFWKREIEINTESCHRRIISAREDVLASQYLIDVLKAEKLNTVPASFWADRQKPEYKETEEFITSLMFNNLKI